MLIQSIVVVGTMMEDRWMMGWWIMVEGLTTMMMMTFSLFDTPSQRWWLRHATSKAIEHKICEE